MWFSLSHKNRTGNYLCVCVYMFFLINVCTLGLSGRIWSTACAFILTYLVVRLELTGYIAPTANLWRPLIATKTPKQTGKQKPNQCCHQAITNRCSKECPGSQERVLGKEQTIPLSQPRLHFHKPVVRGGKHHVLITE